MSSLSFYCPAKESVDCVVILGVGVKRALGSGNTFITRARSYFVVPYRVTTEKIYHLLSVFAIVINFVNLNVYNLYF